LKEYGVALEKAVFISKSKADELEKYKLKTGDLLFSRMAAVGRAGYVTEALEGAIFNYHIMRLRLATGAISPDYFIAYVRGAESVVDYLREINHGFTRDGINTAQLLSLPVAVPHRNEQNRIVDQVERCFSIVREFEVQIDANLTRADRLRQGILKRAFSGNLAGN